MLQINIREERSSCRQAPGNRIPKQKERYCRLSVCRTTKGGADIEKH